MKDGVRFSLCAAISMVTFFAFVYFQQRDEFSALTEKINGIVTVGTLPEISCKDLAAKKPLVLLALGQSNAGNHGDKSNLMAEPIPYVFSGKCIKATDPLPGATGNGGSIWPGLSRLLSLELEGRPVVLSVLAVDATSINDWTSSRSPLRKRFEEHVASMHHLGLPPDAVLWQQGEADARAGTNVADYSKGLDRLADIIEGLGSRVPIFLARSTICRSSQSADIRSAVESKVLDRWMFRLGPDTDMLVGEALRYDGCHFSVRGLDAAAKMWIDSIHTQGSTLGIKPPVRANHEKSR